MVSRLVQILIRQESERHKLGQVTYEANAREIIAAMREPTQKMKDACTRSMRDYDDESDLKIWRAAIDAALED